MKKPLLIAAGIITAGISSVSSDVKAQELTDLFNIKANSAGVLSFKGSGTAQFNNSIGTNNSFQVGSNTNLGVNASASSTPEYGVTNRAKLDLAGSTTLRQIIGTSGASQNTTDAAVAAEQVAHTTADRNASMSAESSSETAANEAREASKLATQKTWENTNGSSWSDFVTGAQAAEDVYAVSGNSDDGYTVAYADSYSGDAVLHTSESAWSDAHTDSFTESSDFSWQEAYDTAYSTNYNDAYESEYAEAQTQTASQIDSYTQSTANSGTIKGTFETRESGASSNSGSMMDWDANAEAKATEEASLAVGSTFEEYVWNNTAKEYAAESIAVDNSAYTEDSSLDDGRYVQVTDALKAEIQGDGDANDDIVVGEYILESVAMSGSTYAFDDSAAFGRDTTIVDQTSWENAQESAYNSAYSQSYATAAAGASRTSESMVEVNGIGSDATIVSRATSTFDVQIGTMYTSIADEGVGSTATANGTAGANLATSSFANQSQASTASAFMQAFGSIEDAEAAESE